MDTFKSYYDNSAIDIGDTIFLINNDTKEKCEYTIVQSYYEYQPFAISRDYYNYGSTMYKKISISDANIEEGIIESDCFVAQMLIGKKVGNIVVLPDGEFLINRIRKHKMYVN